MRDSTVRATGQERADYSMGGSRRWWVLVAVIACLVILAVFLIAEFMYAHTWLGSTFP